VRLTVQLGVLTVIMIWLVSQSWRRLDASVFARIAGLSALRLGAG
jgi:hypothetical protein